MQWINDKDDSRRARRAAYAVVLAWMIGCALSVARADEASASQPTSLLNEAYRRKNAHDLEGAARAFEGAERAGASSQLIALELGYIAATRGESEQARSSFERAQSGPDASVRADAERELAALAPPLSAALDPAPDAGSSSPEPAPPGPHGAVPGHDEARTLLDQAYQRKSARDYAGAAVSFDAARRAGAKAQLIDLELGYLAAARGDPMAARAAFRSAAVGADPELASEAKRQLAASSAQGAREPRGLWFDLYADAFGWKRVRGANDDANLVPSLRLRGLLRVFNRPQLDVYVLAQGTRDVASRGASGTTLPLIYSDNKLLLGGGLMLRVWDGQLGLYTQLAAAFDLVAEDQEPVALDARVGAFLSLHAPTCWPEAAGGAELRAWWCNEVYADAAYINRFDHNVIAFARGRSIVGYARTGPVAWQVALEGRVAKDRNDDFYNNFFDAGIGPLWRLLAPLRVDFMLSVHAGSYFGLENRDPAPHPLGFVDLRALVATYWAVGP